MTQRILTNCWVHNLEDVIMLNVKSALLDCANPRTDNSNFAELSRTYKQQRRLWNKMFIWWKHSALNRQNGHMLPFIECWPSCHIIIRKRINLYDQKMFILFTLEIQLLKSRWFQQWEKIERHLTVATWKFDANHRYRKRHCQWRWSSQRSS